MTKATMDIIEEITIKKIQESIKALKEAEDGNFDYFEDILDPRRPENIVNAMPVCYAKGYLQCILDHSDDAKVYKIYDIEKAALEHDIWLV